ncbi:MAG: hypothetical protein KY455_00490 [Euryarchaeota archaeon]|nr:hypothetical protein [Euryarchaeota archaeon]
MEQILDSSLKRQVQRHVLENPGTTIANIATALDLDPDKVEATIDQNEDTFKKVKARGKSFRIYLRKKPHRARYGADLRRQKIQELVTSEPGITLSKLGLKVSASYQSIYNDVENGKIPGVRMGRGATRRKDIRLYPVNYRPELAPVSDHLEPAKTEEEQAAIDEPKRAAILRTEARRKSTRGPDPEIPEKIKAVVTKEPGLTAKDIADRLENHVPYISKLLKEGIPGVQSRGRGVRGDPKRWFTYEGLRRQVEQKRIAQAEREIEEQFRRKDRGPSVSDQVREVIEANPGVTIQEIAEAIGKAPSYVSTLINKGKVESLVSRGSGARNDPKRYYAAGHVFADGETGQVQLTSDDLFREYLDNRTLSETSLDWLKENFPDYQDGVSVMENLRQFRKWEKANK